MTTMNAKPSSSSNLRKALQALFVFADDPFVEHEGDYRPRFRARVGLPGEAGKA